MRGEESPGYQIINSAHSCTGVIPLMVNANLVAIVMARAFRWAGRHLDGLLANPVIASDPLAAAESGIMWIVLRPFTEELAPKALYMQETGGEPKHQHDLKVLFESLEPTTEASVEQRFERIRQEKIATGTNSGKQTLNHAHRTRLFTSQPPTEKFAIRYT